MKDVPYSSNKSENIKSGLNFFKFHVGSNYIPPRDFYMKEITDMNTQI